MNRRRFLLTTGAVLVGGYAATKFAGAHHLRQFAGQDLLTQLQALRGRTLVTTGVWTPAQIFSHLAQSIEFSMDGYPQAKPAWFQHSAGALAFSAFAAAGAMRHNLAEPIPGAPALDGITDIDAALDRLLASLQRFDAHSGPLVAHFAYGELDKREYRAAHLMHIENHLQELLG